MSYHFDSRIRYSEIEADGHLTMPGVIDYFQDCCIFHSESIGKGVFSEDNEKNLGIVFLADCGGEVSKIQGIHPGKNMAI